MSECGCEGRHHCQYHEGARAERERIVAWLRDVDKTRGLARASTVADAIMRGEHKEQA